MEQYSKVPNIASLNIDTNVLFAGSDSDEDDRSPSHKEETSFDVDQMPSYNDRVPDFRQRVNLYLKPAGFSSYILLLVLFADWAFSWLFLYYQVDYVLTWQYENITDKAM